MHRIDEDHVAHVGKARMTPDVLGDALHLHQVAVKTFNLHLVKALCCFAKTWKINNANARQQPHPVLSIFHAPVPTR